MRYNRKLFALILLIACLVNVAHAQEPTEKEKGKKLAAQAGSNPVIGSGTPGRAARWSGVSGSFTYTLGDSNIFEDKFGKIGIGTTAPTSPLTVQGMIETTLGGYKFPDGTVQTTAFNSSQVVRSLNGLTGDVQLAAGANITITPSGNTLTIAASNALTGVATNSTLTGDGTAALPLGVAVPLVLSGSADAGVITATNSTTGGTGVAGVTSSGFGVLGSTDGAAVDTPILKVGVAGVAQTGIGVLGQSQSGVGMEGSSDQNSAVIGISNLASGVAAITFSSSSQFAAIVGVAVHSQALAGRFNGDVEVNGKLTKSMGTFKIDHPLDPENKYLYHSFVESPDMMNIYNGNVTTDTNGEAVVEMPAYFEALNKDFRYQLTVIGTFAQAIIATKMKGNRFVIKTNAPNVEVSWQVTGVRHDAYAEKNRVKVEEDKAEKERGYYLHPEVFNQPEEKSVQWARDPELMQKLSQQRLEAERKRKGTER